MGAATEISTSNWISLEARSLDRLIEALVASGREVIAPVVTDGAITLASIDSADELPMGWSDRQAPGHYRIEQQHGSTRFGFAAPAQPWKRFLHEEETLLVRTRQTSNGIEVQPSEEPSKPLAFIGVRSCDVAALMKLDVVLASDPHYQRRREGLIIVAVACTTSADTCFCASMGTGPRPGIGADLVLTELDDGSFVGHAETRIGHELIETCGNARPASDDQARIADELVVSCGENQTRRLDPDAVAKAAANPDADGWAAVAESCLTCGNCTMVCPTCFCTSVDDRTPLTTGEAERWQTWDSCFSLDFSYIHGGPIRESASSRYRQWYLHKLVTWHDQFGSSGCVGCGRCIAWCPTGIDITKAVVA